MPTGAHALAGLPPVADLREVVHPDPVDPASMWPWTMLLVVSEWMCRTRQILLPETSRSLPSSTLAAVPGKTATHAKRAVGLVAQFSAAKDFACAYGGEVLFPYTTPTTLPDARACLSSVSTTSLRYHVLSRKTCSASFTRPGARMRFGYLPTHSQMLMRPSIV